VYSSLTMLLCRFRGPLQLRNARLDVFEFDGLGRMIQYAVGGPCTGRWRRRRVNHEPEECSDSCTGSLLKMLPIA